MKSCKALPAGRYRMRIRDVLPSAIRCFFHVYEEPIGKYGLLVLRHVLASGPPQSGPLKTGCHWAVDPYDYVTVTNDIIVDRTWCKACTAVIDAEARRGHAPTPREQILARPVVYPLTKEVL